MKSAVELAKDLGKALAPPEEEYGQRVNAWRWTVAILTIANALGLLAHIALACGLTPLYSGFAGASEVSSLKAVFQQSQLNELAAAIPTMKKKHCEATNSELRQVYWERLLQMMQQYHDLKGVDFPSISCGDVQ